MIATPSPSHGHDRSGRNTLEELDFFFALGEVQSWSRRDLIGNRPFLKQVRQSLWLFVALELAHSKMQAGVDML
jgi:hypothetical protein